MCSFAGSKTDFASYFLRCTLKSEILVSLIKVFYSVLTLNMELLLFHFTELFHAESIYRSLLSVHLTFFLF